MRSKRFVIISIVLVVLAFTGFFVFGNRSASTPDDVDMRGHSSVSIVLTDAGFRPERVVVDAGTTLVFTTSRDKPFWPASNSHPSHSLYPEFDSVEPIAVDAEWSFVIDKKGVWGFHDHIRSYYAGVVRVE